MHIPILVDNCHEEIDLDFWLYHIFNFHPFMFFIFSLIFVLLMFSSVFVIYILSLDFLFYIFRFHVIICNFNFLACICILPQGARIAASRGSAFGEESH